MSLPQKIDMFVNKDSIAVNQPFDEDRFKLTWPAEYAVYDVQEFERAVKQVENRKIQSASLSSRANPQKLTTGRYWIYANLVGITAIAMVLLICIKRKV